MVVHLRSPWSQSSGFLWQRRSSFRGGETHQELASLAGAVAICLKSSVVQLHKAAGQSESNTEAAAPMIGCSPALREHFKNVWQEARRRFRYRYPEPAR